MKLIQSLQLLACICLVFASTQVAAQNPGWVTCGTTAGILNGTTTNIYMADTTPAASLTVTPGPIGTIPQTEYLIILKDSMALDSLGAAIIATNFDGRVSPTDLGLMIGDTFSVVAFSYDIQQIKLAINGILHHDVNFFLSCCGALDLAAPFPGICDSLIAAGISDSSDVNSMDDLLAFLAAFTGGGSTSLRGLNALLVGINAQIGTLAGFGCTNNVTELCYATDSLEISHDHYVVTTMVNVSNIQGTESLKLAVSPNPFFEQISTGIMTEHGGEHMIRILDATGRTVYHDIQNLGAGEQTLTLNLGNLAAGLYYLQVSDNNNLATQKIIKR